MDNLYANEWWLENGHAGKRVPTGDLIGYHGCSEVNHDRFRRLADAFGENVALVDFRDDLSRQRLKGLVLDFDSWAPADRDRLLTSLLLVPLPYPVVIFTYEDLDRYGQIEQLVRRGVRIFRQISPGIFDAFNDTGMEKAA